MLSGRIVTHVTGCVPSGILTGYSYGALVWGLVFEAPVGLPCRAAHLMAGHREQFYVAVHMPAETPVRTDLIEETGVVLPGWQSVLPPAFGPT